MENNEDDKYLNDNDDYATYDDAYYNHCTGWKCKLGGEYSAQGDVFECYDDAGYANVNQVHVRQCPVIVICEYILLLCGIDSWNMNRTIANLLTYFLFLSYSSNGHCGLIDDHISVHKVFRPD